MLEVFRVALTSIRGNLFRAALTMLGVIIGVAAVITMLALGTGAQRAVEQQLAALGANVITVTTGMRFAQGVAREQQVLTTDDADAVRDGARNVTAVSPEQSSRQQVKLGGRNLNLSVIGTAPEHPAVNGYSIQAGRMFTAIDDSSRRRVAVLGGEVPELLETTADALLGQHDHDQGPAVRSGRHLREEGRGRIRQSRRRRVHSDQHVPLPRDRPRQGPDALPCRRLRMRNSRRRWSRSSA